MPDATRRGAADRMAVLASVCLAGLMMPLSFTGPSVAMAEMARDLHAEPMTLGWVVNAFVLGFGSCVMAAGALADRFGRKRIFTLGVALFALLSLVMGRAPDVYWLIALRAMLGIVAAMAMSAGSASLAQEFEGPARTRAYGMLGTSFGVGLAFGPIGAGFLIETFGWRSLFLTGTVIGVLVLVLGVPRMRETSDPEATGVDGWGTVTFTLALLSLTMGVVQVPEHGWSSPWVLGLLGGSVLLLGAFVLAERLQRRPMLDLSLFRYPRFVGAQLLPLATGFGFVVSLVLLPIRFVGIEGRGAFTAGMMMIPLSAPMLVVPLLASFLTRWISAATLSGIGLAVSAAGLFWLATIAPGASAGSFAAPMLVIGLGTGAPWGLMDDLAVSVVPRERAGMATGIFSTMRVAGEGVAIAITSALLSTQLARKSAAGLGPSQTYAQAFQTTFQVLACIVVFAAILSWVTLRRPALRTEALGEMA
ncbi:MFS transporter [Pendulispora albinea]|uniref:MFS transporter n=1 Tax=Pendulispora albinea TaxID=2741071 RepID=A0ABZ2M961_9BACT